MIYDWLRLNVLFKEKTEQSQNAVGDKESKAT